MIDIVNDQKDIRLSRTRIKRLVNYVLKKEGSKRTEVTLLICRDDKIQEFNKNYFGIDQATDVIAFGMPTETITAERKYLGDIIISAETAKRQCVRYKQAPLAELERYIVHGVLHLLGYEDEAKDDYQRMHTRQEELLTEFYETNK